MKRKIILSIAIILFALIAIFIFNRFKTKRIDHLIGVNQQAIEKQLNYPNELVTLVKMDTSTVNEQIKELLKTKSLTSPLVLKYTLTGSVRKQLIWLINEGNGYYVVEAIDTNRPKQSL